MCGANGKLRGIVTDRDIVLRCVASENDPDTTPVKEIMSRCVLTASPDSSVDAVSYTPLDVYKRQAVYLAEPVAEVIAVCITVTMFVKKFKKTLKSAELESAQAERCV